MRLVDNTPINMATLAVDQMSQIRLNKLRRDTHKVTIYHQSSTDGVDRQVLFEGVSAGLLSAFSPCLKALLESDTTKKSVSITGGAASACKEVIRYMHKYADDKKALPALVGDSELLTYFQLHEAAEVLQVKTVSDWAMKKADTVLESPVSPDDVTAVLSKYTDGRYQGLLRYNLAYCMSAWLGGWSENCQFVENLRESHPAFVVQLRATVGAFNAERNDAWTAKSKALFAEDERVWAEEERKAKQAEKRKAYQKERKNRQRAETVSHQVAGPVRKVSPSPAGSYAAVAAAPSTASRPRATTIAPATQSAHSGNRARTQTVAHSSPSAIKAVAARAAAPENSWASVARHGAERAAQ